MADLNQTATHLPLVVLMILTWLCKAGQHDVWRRLVGRLTPRSIRLLLHQHHTSRYCYGQRLLFDRRCVKLLLAQLIKAYGSIYQDFDRFMFMPLSETGQNILSCSISDGDTSLLEAILDRCNNDLVALASERDNNNRTALGYALLQTSREFIVALLRRLYDPTNHAALRPVLEHEALNLKRCPISNVNPTYRCFEYALRAVRARTPSYMSLNYPRFLIVRDPGDDYYVKLAQDVATNMLRTLAFQVDIVDLRDLLEQIAQSAPNPHGLIIYIMGCFHKDFFRNGDMGVIKFEDICLRMTESTNPQSPKILFVDGELDAETEDEFEAGCLPQRETGDVSPIEHDHATYFIRIRGGRGKFAKRLIPNIKLRLNDDLEDLIRDVESSFGREVECKVDIIQARGLRFSFGCILPLQLQFGRECDM